MACSLSVHAMALFLACVPKPMFSICSSEKLPVCVGRWGSYDEVLRDAPAFTCREVSALSMPPSIGWL
jgi:hypothetical protein